MPAPLATLAAATDAETPLVLLDLSRRGLLHHDVKSETLTYAADHLAAWPAFLDSGADWRLEDL
jgi:hypothetical protein